MNTGTSTNTNTTSMNHLMYDKCATVEALNQSVSPLSYMLDPIKYEHCNKCRIELGLVGGTAVSHVSGDLVALENNLIGLDRPGTLCSSYKYAPVGPGEPLQGHEYIKPVCHPVIDTRMLHLRPCQMQSFPEIPAPPQHTQFVCPNGK